MADENEPRVYGLPDGAGRESAEGLRGARATSRPRHRDPSLSHIVPLETGRTVVLREGSGVAYAEATGRAGLAEPKAWRDTSCNEETRAHRRVAVPVLAGLAVATGIATLALWRLRPSA